MKQEASSTITIPRKTFLRLNGYREPMPVNEIMMFSSSICGDASYYVCPKCKVTLEWEFMDFCDRCGQKLDWKGCKKAKIIYPGTQNAPAKNLK